jgi:hypothetical protein
MRLAIALLALALAADTMPAAAQQSPPPAAPACTRTDATVAGGIGRATIVAFTGSVTGARVCALVVNLAFDVFSSSLEAAPGPDDAVTASVGAGKGAVVATGPQGLNLIPAASDPPAATAATVGPFVVEPGGAFPSLGGDTSEVPRVVLGYAGPRVVLIRTTAVSLLDLAHALRDHPDLFGTDAFERAAVIAGGETAALSVRTADGSLLGTPPAGRVLGIMKRA